MINKVGLSMPVYTRNTSVGFKEAGGQSETPQQIAQRILEVDESDPDQIDAFLRSIEETPPEVLRNAASKLRRGQNTEAALYLDGVAKLREAEIN